MYSFTLGIFLSSVGVLWAFLPIYLLATAATNSNVPFILEAKILGTLHLHMYQGVKTKHLIS